MEKAESLKTYDCPLNMQTSKRQDSGLVQKEAHMVGFCVNLRLETLI
jgi:hypothetical protein